MGKLHRLQPVAVALLLSLPMSSCLVTRRVIFRGHKPVKGVSPALRVATREELTGIIARIFDDIHSFQATSVDIKPSQGSVYEGKINDSNVTFSGLVLFRKPDDIRIRGMVPVVQTRAFDMVSNGSDFRFLLEKGSLFFEGKNSAPAHSTNRMENLRPEAFLSSMLIRPANPVKEYIFLRDDTDEDNALYRLEFHDKAADGTPLTAGREVWFDRLDLSIVRQKVFDETGLTVSDTSYSKWQRYNGALFPAHIDINRPKDGYGVTITILKMEMNKEMNDSQFVLAQPEGFNLRVIQ
jgi:outer membrane lipoprotein-sorting protein